MTSIVHPPLCDPQWWKEAVIYQIYPSSYLDTTGSGTGDLNGITSKLSYIKSLGVDVIWLSPIYASPMNDMGYDISDYRAINPAFGSMADWENLCAKAHEIGLKLVMDLVVNHTSNQHAWFQESVKGGLKGSKRDWYVWRQPHAQTGEEPNNWGAMFGGSTWAKDPSKQTSDYYLHVFDVSQPDLNWENQEVRDAVWDVMRFWLDKGCDGFRMDVINCISKTPGFPDVEVTDPNSKFQYGLKHRFDGPKVQEYLLEMHEKVLSKYSGPPFTVGECPGTDTPEKGIKYVKDGQPLQMIFNFEHVGVDVQPGKKPFFHLDSWKLTALKDVLGGWFSYMQEHNGWDSLYLENHDQPRILQRWATADPAHRVAAAKMLAIFHATGRGTLFLYQGQEIGTANSPQWSREELRDLEEIYFYDNAKKLRGDGADMSDVLLGIQRNGRDNARMGVQWDDSSNGGFTTGTPWIKTNEEYKEINVAKQEGDSTSVLSFWRDILKIRKANPTLVYGWFQMLDYDNEQIYAYTRTDEKANQEFLVLCNFSGKDVAWKAPVPLGSLVTSSHARTDESGEMLKLKAYEGRLYERKLK